MIKPYRALKTFKSYLTGKVSANEEFELEESQAIILLENNFIEDVKLPQGALYVAELEDIPEETRMPKVKKLPKKKKG